MKNSKCISVTSLLFSLFVSTTGYASSVLVVGDQRLKTEFGQQLDQGLRSIPMASVAIFSACDSNPDFWAEGQTTNCGYYEKLPDGHIRESEKETVPPLVTLLSLYAPKYTVVVTGESDLGAGSKKLQNQLRSLSTAIRNAGSTCLWIGPEAPRRGSAAEHYYDALRMISDESNCALVDVPLLTQISDESSAVASIVTEMVKIEEE